MLRCNINKISLLGLVEYIDAAETVSKRANKKTIVSLAQIRNVDCLIERVYDACICSQCIFDYASIDLYAFCCCHLSHETQFFFSLSSDLVQFGRCENCVNKMDAVIRIVVVVIFVNFTQLSVISVVMTPRSSFHR